MKRKLLIYLIPIIIIIIIFIFFSCSKKPDPQKRIVYITNTSGEKIAITVLECIKDGIVTKDMTIKECNEAVKGTFKLKIKLEDDWAIYSYKEEYKTTEIFFKGNIAKNIEDLQNERLLKVFKKMQENN